MSLKANNEELMMHSNSDNIEIMINDKSDEVTEELFHVFLDTGLQNINER